MLLVCLFAIVCVSKGIMPPALCKGEGWGHVQRVGGWDSGGLQ